MHHALDIAERLSGGLAADALALALVGSVAAGTDHPDSDIDLIVVTDTDAGTEVRSVEGRMVTLTRTTVADLTAALGRPGDAVFAVPAWRTARLLHDPHGTLAAHQHAARDWTWAHAPDADRWAAAALVGLAEEVHKVCGMHRTGRTRPAAANAAVIALALGHPLAVAHRLLLDSENDLWDALADAEGPAWASAWDTAIGAPPDRASAAALALYRLAVDRLEAHLDHEGRAVVAAACALANT